MEELDSAGGEKRKGATDGEKDGVSEVARKRNEEVEAPPIALALSCSFFLPVT